MERPYFCKECGHQKDAHNHPKECRCRSKFTFDAGKTYIFTDGHFLEAQNIYKSLYK
jgi:hypothetical protein